MTRTGLGEDRLTRHGRPIRWEPDVLSRVHAPRQHPQAVPETEIEDEDTICIRVNVKWIPHIIGMIDVLTYPDSWEGDESEVFRGTQNIERLIELLMLGGECGEEMPCCDDLIIKFEQLIEINQQIVNNQQTIIDNSSYTVINESTEIYNDYTTNNNAQLIINQTDYNGTPESIAPDIGEDFDSDEDRLCQAVKAYVDQIVYQETQTIAQEAALLGLAAGSVISGLIAAAPLTGGASAALGIAASVIGGLTLFAFNQWLTAMQDPGNKKKVICCMMDGLRGQEVTLANFQNSVQDCGFDGFSPEANIAGRLHHYNQQEDNYLAFLRAYNNATGGNAGDCACCEDEAILEDYAGTGCEITHMGGCVYRFTPALGEDDNYKASFKDVLDRCLNLEVPVDYPSGHVDAHNIIGCCGMPDSETTGGFVPYTVTQALWSTGLESSVVYIKITVIADESECP